VLSRNFICLYTSSVFDAAASLHCFFPLPHYLPHYFTCWQSKWTTHVNLQLDVNHKTVNDWFSFLRDLCSWDLRWTQLKLRGPGHIVAVDESCVARAKTAANRHARPVAAQWVFGAVDLTTNDFVMELVPHRDCLTLLPIISAPLLLEAKSGVTSGEGTTGWQRQDMFTAALIILSIL